MKTPRVADFYPDTKIPPLKSSLEDMPAIGKPNPPQSSDKPLNQTNQATPERANARSSVRPNGKRIITRNAFEIYEDQMDSLRKLSFEEKMDGKLGSMSAMVRDAIDAYLQKRTSRK